MSNGDIDTLVKKSLQMTKKDFYNDLLNSFEKKLIFIGAGANSEMYLNIKKKLKQFSGVAVFWKNEPMERRESQNSALCLNVAVNAATRRSTSL